MSVPNAIPLIAKIKADVENGRIADLRAVHIALEDVISQLIHEQDSQPSNAPNDNLFDILVEMKLINEKVDMCNAKLAGLQDAQSEVKVIAKSVAEETGPASIVPQQTSTPSTTSEGAFTVLPPLPASPPPSLPLPNARNPSGRRAYVYFHGGPRTVTIHPPGSPDHQSLIRDQQGNVIIALDGHLQRNSLRREGAFYGEEDLVLAVRNDNPVYGCQMSPLGPSASQSVPTSGLTNRTARPLQRTDAQLKLDVTGISELTPPSPPRNGRGKKRARDEGDDKGDEDKAATVSSAQTHPPPGERAEDPDPSFPLLRRSRVFDFGSHSEVGEATTPTPAKRRPGLVSDSAKRQRLAYPLKSNSGRSTVGKGSPARAT